MSSFGGDFPVQLLTEFILPVYLSGIFIFYLIRGICLWGVFKKAGKTPWVGLIPILNFVILLDITEKPKYWIIGLFLPFVSYVVYFLVYVALAKKFGKNTWFGIGTVILPFIFLAILGFGDATLKGQKQEFYDDEILDRG